MEESRPIHKGVDPEEVLRLYEEEYWSVPVIAREFGVAENTIRYHLRKMKKQES